MSVLKKRKQAEFPEEPELVEKITELRDQIAEKALNVVHVRLPKLVLHLDTLAKVWLLEFHFFSSLLFMATD